MKSVTKEKEELIRLVSAALIKEPSFDAPKRNRDEFANSAGSESDSSSCSTDDSEATSGFLEKESPTNAMIRLGRVISDVDGEFLLKIAVYIRQDLGIRGSANFITAIAAYQPNCQPYLAAYLPKIISLPSDWLQIASFARDLPMRITCGIPTSLRKALAQAFLAFNEFSLAKYNTESAQRKRKKEMIEKGTPEDDINMPYTLKQMIRMLHISAPPYEVMCILGKAYPATSDAFSSLGLGANGRTFDATKANRRMRLAIPRTWETDLASQGSHAHVWDALVADRKLPFMATLRNLRNIVLAGCSRPTHNAVLARLRSEDQVASSKQFPYRFFSAFDVLKIDPEKAYDAPQVKRAGAPTKAKPKPATAPTPEQLGALLEEYRNALEESVRLATKLNIRPIHGKSIILIHGSSSLLGQVRAQGAKGIGSVRTMLDVSLLLAVMFQYACEACDFVVFAGKKWQLMPAVDRSQGILTALEAVRAEVTNMISANEFDDTLFPFDYLDEVIHRKQDVQSVIVVGEQHCSYEGMNRFPALGGLRNGLSRMRRECNEDLLFVNLAIDGSNSPCDINEAYSHPNDVLLTGFSDAILRFVAERGGGGPRRYIESIDQVYKVDLSKVVLRDGTTRRPPLAEEEDDSGADDDDDFDDDDDSDSTQSDDGSECSRDGAKAKGVVEQQPPLEHTMLQGSKSLSTYRTCRWFVSSTFLDMDCERNALVLDVFPEIRSWVAKKGWKLSITEIDFRWGITSEMAAQAATPVNICLNEVSRCAPFFFSMLGSRYGWSAPTKALQIRADKDVDAQDFAWLRDVSESSMSVTEMEIRHAICSREGRLQVADGIRHSTRLIAMIRSIGAVPTGRKPIFDAESKESAARVANLHSLVTKHEAFRTKHYKAHFVQGSREPSSELDMTHFREHAVDMIKKSLLEQYADCFEDECSDDEDECITEEGSSLDERSSCSGSSSSSSSSVPQVVTPSMLAGAEQRYFQSNLAATYVAPKGSMRAVKRFLNGEDPSLDEAAEGDDNGADSNQRRPPNVLLVHSEEGRGKSAFLSFVAQSLADSNDLVVLPFFFQAYQGSNGEYAIRACVRFIATYFVKTYEMDEQFTIPKESVDEWAGIAKMLPEILAAAGKRCPRGSRFLFVLDGLDANSSALLLTTLPCLIPTDAHRCFAWIVATHRDSVYAQALRSRPIVPAHYHLPNLLLPERMQLVQRHLSLIGKELECSVTKGNYLKTLCRKTDAGITSYLMLSLTFLRLFSKFDTLKNDIQRLPGTYVHLQQEVIRRCEAAFSVESCAAVFPFLALAAPLNGISEGDLYRSSGCVTGATRIVNFILSSDLAIRKEGDRICLKNDAIVKAVFKKYLSRTLDIQKGYYRMLMGLVTKSPSTALEPPSSTTSAPAEGSASVAGGGVGCPVAALITDHWISESTPATVLSAMHFALGAKRWMVVETIVKNIGTLAALIKKGMMPQILNIVATVKEQDRFTFRRLTPYAEFLVKNRHILARRPKLAAQCALNMPNDHAVAIAAKQSLYYNTYQWIEWTTKSLHGEKECVQTSVWSNSGVTCVAFSPDGSRVAAGSKDWICRVGNVYDGVVALQLKHKSEVTSVAFPSNGPLLFTGAADGVLRSWSLIDGAMLQEGSMHSRCVTEVALFPNRPTVLTSSDDTTVALWTYATGTSNSSSSSGAVSKMRNVKTFRHHNSPASCCAVHQGGVWFASGAWNGTVVVQSSSEGQKNIDVRCTTNGAVRCVAFVPSMVVTLSIAYFNGKISLFDVAGEVLSATFDEHTNSPITSIHYSSDAKLMLSADGSGCLKVWRASVTGEVLCSLSGHSVAITGTRFHPTKPTSCVSSSKDSTIRHWELPNLGIDEHIGGVMGTEISYIAVAPLGQFIVIASRSGWAKVVTQFSSDESGFSSSVIRPKHTLNGDVSTVPLCYAGITPDLDHIILGDILGTITVWTRKTYCSETGLQFVVKGAMTHPVVFVEKTEDRYGAMWVAASNAGEIIRFRVPNEEFAVAAESVDFIGSKEFVSHDLEGQVIAVCQLPSNDKRLIVTESHEYIWFVDATRTDPRVTDSDVHESQATCAAACSEFSIVGHHDGTLTLTPVGSDAMSNNGSSSVSVVIMDDRDGKTAVSIAAVALSPDPARDPECLAACSCADFTIRVFSASVRMPADRLTLRYVFHSSSVTSALTFVPFSSHLLAGDRVGNFYTLMIHEAKEECSESLLAESESVTVEEASVAPTTPYSEGSYEVAESGRDNADYWRELGTPMPRGLSAESKREWMRRQRGLLQEAAKCQKVVPEARTALRRYASKSMQMFDTYMAMQ